MIGDRDLSIKRDSNSTPWLVDIIWSTAARLGQSSTFSNQLTTIEDDHIPFLRAGVAAVDLIDLENPTWHTAQDDLEHVSARSLQTVGDVVVAAIPEIEKRILARQVDRGADLDSCRDARIGIHKAGPDPEPESGVSFRL